MRSIALRSCIRALAIAVLLQAPAAVAQTTRVSGRVYDELTKEPLPFASVAFVDSRIGTATDFDGLYALDTYYATDSLVVSCMGYVSRKVKVKRDQAQVIDVALAPASEVMKVAEIRPTEDLAYGLLRRVVHNKPANNREKLEAYEFQAYNKIQFDLNNISEEFTKKKLFKQFDFIFDYIDSSQAKPALPMFMTESLSEVYYRQKPRTRREVIRGTKVSGLENESISQFMGDMYQNVNIYDNFLVIFGKNFISPIADGGRGYYDYKLIDSNWVDLNWCYEVKFTPKRPQELAFAGTLWIADTSYAVRRIEAGIPANANLNFVQAFEVRQEYNQVAKEVWMLTRDELLVDLNIIRDTGDPNKHPVQGFYGHRKALYRDFLINRPRDDAFFSGVDEVIVEKDPLSLGEDYWATNRFEPLTKKENDIYYMVDTMKQVPRFRTYVDIVNTIMTGYYPAGNLELGPYFTTISFNAVEGARFRVGGRTSNQFSKWVEFEGYTAFGTLDEEFKYGLKTRGFFTKEPRLLYRLGYKYDIEQLGASTDAFREDNLLSSILRRNPANKLTMVEEFMASVEREWFTGMDNALMFRHRILSPRGDLAYYKYTESGDPPVEEVSSITTSEFVLSTRWAHKEKYISGEFDRVSLGTVYPTVEAYVVLGVPDVFRSQYDYQKVGMRVQQRVQMGTLGYANYMVTGGKLWGAVPYPLLFLHSGNETFYYDDAGFNTMNYFEFLSDQAVSTMVQWHLEGLFFNRVPLLRRLKWREVASFKGVIGSLDAERHMEEMLFLPGMYDLEEGPFMEASAGVENILKILRVDMVWRLAYQDHPNVPLWALRFKLNITF